MMGNDRFKGKVSMCFTSPETGINRKLNQLTKMQK